jgi:hypothetical protein
MSWSPREICKLCVTDIDSKASVIHISTSLHRVQQHVDALSNAESNVHATVAVEIGRHDIAGIALRRRGKVFPVREMARAIAKREQHAIVAIVNNVNMAIPIEVPKSNG